MSEATGRTLWAALQLLDRQLRDRHDILCGNVDDVELTYDDDEKVLYATAILSGPGRLARRMGRRRVGDWLVAFFASTTVDGHDPSRIPFRVVRNFGPVIDLAVDADDLASFATERWVRDHVISHIPGNDHAAE
ncbi:MAG: hypothetical protein ABI658_10905 [Acidimicrobiales bacterium]